MAEQNRRGNDKNIVEEQATGDEQGIAAVEVDGMEKVAYAS